MGCAGSKPHLLLSSNITNYQHHNHANSAQKGFILFNAKTIDYLTFNESETKKNLIQRCELKLIKTMTQSSSSKSFLNNAKTLLMNQNSSNEEKQNNKYIKSIKKNKSNLSLAYSDNIEIPSSISSKLNSENDKTQNKSKETIIRSAVEYVLKYAINDFNIENFKSSNHISMKQIRKDIMKKYQYDRNGASSPQASNLVSIATNVSTCATSISTEESLLKDVPSPSKLHYDVAFYKLALNTAIDEFGLFIQENFIEINDFQSKLASKETICPLDVAIKSEEIKSVSTIDEQKEALKLKEALEVARQNFYKGKVSMVCLNKTGGYVVKEVKENEEDFKENASKANFKIENPTKELPYKDMSSQLSHESIVEVENKNLFSKKLVNNFENDTKEIFVPSDVTGTKLIKNKYDFAKILNRTIESIVNYTTKSAIFNEAINFEFENEFQKSDFIRQLQGALEHCLLLKNNLDESKSILEILTKITEDEYKIIDEKLIDTVLNLDYVNKEFKHFLILFEDSLKHRLKISPANSIEGNTYISAVQENSNLVIQQKSELRKCVEYVDNQINNLPKELFFSKGRPHPTEATDSTVDVLIDNKNKNKMTPRLSFNCIKTFNEEKNFPFKSTKINSCSVLNNSMDIRREIAFSILNIGEVLAKTIDYYSLDTKDGRQDEDLKQLIKLSENQAAIDKQKFGSFNIQQPTEDHKNVTFINSKANQKSSSSITSELNNLKLNELHVLTKSSEKEEKDAKSKTRAYSIKQTPESASSLSSPSISTSISPSSLTGSTFLCTKNTNNGCETSSENKINNTVRNNLQEATNLQDYDDVIEKVKSNINEQKHVESRFLIRETSFLQVNPNQKSISSSSDVLSDDYSSSDIPKFLSNIIENSKIETVTILSKGSLNYQCEESKINNDDVLNNSVKRMSLDEELLYQIEDVDKKVKYMNETCSENEDNEDLGNENFDLDLSTNHADIEQEKKIQIDDEDLFRARTPAKIKSQLRQNRAIELNEEIKQISNVIQDLVQTINVKNTSNCLKDEDEFLNSSFRFSDRYNFNDIFSNIDKNNLIKEYPEKVPVNEQYENKLKRNESSNSSIPIRQKSFDKKINENEKNLGMIKLTAKKNCESIDNSLTTKESFKSTKNFESFINISSISQNKSNKLTHENLTSISPTSTFSNHSMNIHNNNNTKKFRSKLPIKNTLNKN